MLDRHSPKKPDAIDVQVGRNIRSIRIDRDMSQEKLAEGLGLTFQQIQKYEKGTNRVSASKLIGIATILKVEVVKLFEGTDSHETEDSPSTAMSKPEARFMAAYRAAPASVQNAVATLIRYAVRAEEDIAD